MSKILLSIKPKYVNLILNGSKKYEFRKRLPQQKIDSIVIYSTSPSMVVVGEVKVIKSIEMSPSALWELTKESAGISRENFHKYFKGCKKAFAYELGEIIKYNEPKRLEELGVFTPPQSFIYLKPAYHNYGE